MSGRKGKCGPRQVESDSETPEDWDAHTSSDWGWSPSDDLDSVPESHRVPLDDIPQGLRIGGYPVSPTDFRTLQPRALVNDGIINVFLQFLNHRARTTVGPDRIRFLNTHLWARARGDMDLCKRASRWNARTSILNSRWLFLPVHSSLHWSLLGAVNIRRWLLETAPPGPRLGRRAPTASASVGCKAEHAEVLEISSDDDDDGDGSGGALAGHSNAPAERSSTVNLSGSCSARPVFLSFDSMDHTHNTKRHPLSLFFALRWVHELSFAGYDVSHIDPRKLARRMVREMQVIRARVPVQDNGHDCGVFLMHYADLLCDRTLLTAMEGDTRKWARQGLRDWFGKTPEDTIGRKRPYLADLLRWFRKKQGTHRNVSFEAATAHLGEVPLLQRETRVAFGQVRQMVARVEAGEDRDSSDDAVSAEEVDDARTVIVCGEEDSSADEEKKRAEQSTFKSLFKQAPAEQRAAAKRKLKKKRRPPEDSEEADAPEPRKRRRRRRRPPESSSADSAEAPPARKPRKVRGPPDDPDGCAGAGVAVPQTPSPCESPSESDCGDVVIEGGVSARYPPVDLAKPQATKQLLLVPDGAPPAKRRKRGVFRRKERRRPPDAQLSPNRTGASAQTVLKPHSITRTAAVHVVPDGGVTPKAAQQPPQPVAKGKKVRRREVDADRGGGGAASEEKGGEAARRREPVPKKRRVHGDLAGTLPGLADRRERSALEEPAASVQSTEAKARSAAVAAILDSSRSAGSRRR